MLCFDFDFIVTGRRQKLELSLANTQLSTSLLGDNESSVHSNPDIDYNESDDENYSKSPTAYTYSGEDDELDDEDEFDNDEDMNVVTGNYKYTDGYGKKIRMSQADIENVSDSKQVKWWGNVIKKPNWKHTYCNEQMFEENENNKYYPNSFNPFTQEALVNMKVGRSKQMSVNPNSKKKRRLLRKNELIHENDNANDNGGALKATSSKIATLKGKKSKGRSRKAKASSTKGKPIKIKYAPFNDDEDKLYDTGVPTNKTVRFYVRHYIPIGGTYTKKNKIELGSWLYIRCGTTSENWKWIYSVGCYSWVCTPDKIRTVVGGDLDFDILVDTKPGKKKFPDGLLWEHDNTDADCKLPTSVYYGNLAQAIVNIELEHAFTFKFKESKISTYVEYLSYFSLRSEKYYQAQASYQFSYIKALADVDINISVVSRFAQAMRCMDRYILAQKCLRWNWCQANSKFSVDFTSNRLLYNFSFYDPLSGPLGGIKYWDDPDVEVDNYVPVIKHFGLQKLCLSNFLSCYLFGVFVVLAIIFFFSFFFFFFFFFFYFLWVYLLAFFSFFGVFFRGVLFVYIFIFFGAFRV